MGQNQSSQQSGGKIPIIIRKKHYNTRKMIVPYSQLEMILVLQRNFNYEVKGTLYFDEEYKFRSFEVRTDNSEIYSTGSEDWRISYHTHPDKTAQKYGLRYYSPPSVDDVMEILDKTIQFVPDTIPKKMGEISIIFANEGIYVLIADRELFAESSLSSMSEDNMEQYLQVHFNEFITGFVKKSILEIKPGTNLTNPDISAVDFYSILDKMSKQISLKFGFRMEFHSWDLLKREGLVFHTSEYFVKTLDD